MANIDKNIDNNETEEKKEKTSIKNVKEKVKKLSWWAKLFLFCFFSCFTADSYQYPFGKG